MRLTCLSLNSSLARKRRLPHSAYTDQHTLPVPQLGRGPWVTWAPVTRKKPGCYRKKGGGEAGSTGETVSTGEAVTAGESAVDAYTLNPVSSLVTLRPWAAHLIAPQ